MANKRRRVAAKRSNEDISKKTLAVFVAIVVIVSVVGTWLILTNNLAVKSTDSVQGIVKLEVLEPGAQQDNTAAVGGQVKLTVEQPS